LQKFAQVIPQLQEIQKSAQQQVSEAIEEAGLSEDRFRELYNVQQSPTATQTSTPATPQEQQAVQQVVSQLEDIKSETQTRRVQAVESQGLELNRFNEILTAVRQDSDLQQQLQQILSN
jgi:phage shock protein A